MTEVGHYLMPVSVCVSLGLCCRVTKVYFDTLSDNTVHVAVRSDQHPVKGYPNDNDTTTDGKRRGNHSNIIEDVTQEADGGMKETVSMVSWSTDIQIIIMIIMIIIIIIMIIIIIVIIIIVIIVIVIIVIVIVIIKTTIIIMIIIIIIIIIVMIIIIMIIIIIQNMMKKEAVTKLPKKGQGH